jgi:hypothetical protein
MVQSYFQALLLAVTLTCTIAFAPKLAFTTSTPSSALHATAPPTMVIYWTIKSGIDLVSYGLGATDKFKGTGVYSGIQLERREQPKKPDGDQGNEDKTMPANNVKGKTADDKGKAKTKTTSSSK